MQKIREVLRFPAIWSIAGLISLTLPLTANGQRPAFSVQQVRYRVTGLGGLDTDFNGYVQSVASGINNAGDVVGTSSFWGTDKSAIPSSAAFLYHNGIMTRLQGLSTNAYGNENSGAYAINNAGDIVGLASVYNGFALMGSTAVLWHNGTLINLGINFGTRNDGWTLVSACSINDSGDIVGNSEVYDQDHNYQGHCGFLYHNGAFSLLPCTSLDSLGRYECFAGPINAAGDIVGCCDAAEPGRPASIAQGISSALLQFPETVWSMLLFTIMG